MPWQDHQFLLIYPSPPGPFYYVSNVSKIYFCVSAFLVLDHLLFSVTGALKTKNAFFPIQKSFTKEV